MSTQYATSTFDDATFPIVTLSDGQGREVKIAPSAGFNAFSFRILHNGEPYEVLVGPDSDQALRKGGLGLAVLSCFHSQTARAVAVTLSQDRIINSTPLERRQRDSWSCT
jgi:hypothetical protein